MNYKKLIFENKLDNIHTAVPVKLVKLIIEAAYKSYKVGRILGEISNISNTLDKYLGEGNRHMIWQRWFMSLDICLDYILISETPDIVEEINKEDPNTQTWSWALQIAANYLKENNYFDEYNYPKMNNKTEAI